jgi:medium-chain acyl-[acyl-carrier-protein] hydrolase
MNAPSQRHGGGPDLPPAPSPQTTLIAFPHAGAGASVFRAWAPLLGPDVELAAMRLPGREERCGEPSATGVHAMLEATEPQWSAACRAPYAVFGHSVGALAAFELVRELRRRGRAAPTALIVSGRVAPQVRSGVRHVHALPDDELAAYLGGLGGNTAAALAEPRLRALFLPPLRADLACDERYQYIREPPLDTPLAALCGTGDPRAPLAGARAWSVHTTGRFRLRPVPGGHFFVFEQREGVVACIRAILRRAAPTAVC